MKFQMEHWKIYRVLAFVVFLAIVANAKRGYILTAPKVLKTGTIEHLTLTLFEIKKEGHVTVQLLTVQLLKEHNDDVLVETTVAAIPDHSMWVELLIPNVPYKKARLRIYSVFEHDDGYRIDEKKEVYLEQKSFLIFVQTDKPIYKPGQTVNFRVLPVDIRLEPVDTQTVGDIWIENPSGIRVEQWKNVSFAKGLVQLSMPLSNEATLGDWTIYIEILGKNEEQKFEVAKYVLPRFEVTATPQRYLLANASTATWEICAKYTYGKRVDGILRGNVTYEQYQWEKASKTYRALPFVDFEQPISGCSNVEINTADLIFKKRLFSRGLLLFAEVAENDTDIVQNVTSRATVHSEPLKIKILTEQGNYFKPGIPYRGKAEVTTPDNVPAVQELVSICIRGLRQQTHTQACKKFTSDEDGHIYFTIPPQHYSAEEIHIKAEAVHFSPEQNSEMKKPTALVTLNKWFSPSQSYIQIEPPIRTFSCESQEEVKVIYTPTVTPPSATTIKFYHQIISRGQIVKQGYHLRTFSPAEEKGRWSYDTYIRDNRTLSEPLLTNGEFILKFDSRSFMSPIARLLVFYVHPSGETVADSKAFVLNDCLPNKVNFTFGQKQQYPGSEASVKIKAQPNSLCGVTVVDKSVHLMTSNNKFNRNKIFNVLKKYDLNEHSRPFPNFGDYCGGLYTKNWGKGFDEGDLRRRKRSSYLHPPVGADAMTAFEGAGMVVLSDLTLKTRPCYTFEHPLFANQLKDAVSLNSGRERTINDPFSIFELRTFVHTSESVPMSEKEDEASSSLRSYFPETWLWELQDVGETGEIDLKRELPHTITEWMGNAVCISPQAGLGVSDIASIVTFKPFFVSMILPYSVTRGEKAPILVKVFNYLSYCLPILLILESTKEFEVMNNTYSHKLCICGSESATRRFMIQPNVLGNVTLTVNGYPLEDDEICNGQYTALMSASDGASRNLLVMAEGFYQEYTKTTYFCPKDYPDETFTESFAVSFPDNIVEGSELVYLSVTGDIMGPSLNGLQKLVRLPVGCGEQNMVLFAPNIFVLDYLSSTNRLNDDLKFTILDYMKTGYQRELNYRHQDGSYSAFGASDPSGSMWLTAFVIKSFSQARRYIDVDNDDLSISTEWIIKQQLENGCFPSIGKLHNQAMKGGISENQQTFTTLTAYTVISLLESGMKKSSKVIKNALFCMHNEPNPTSYSLAVFAYASALAEDHLATAYLQRLIAKSTYKDGILYWDSEYKSSRSISVEIGAYSILTCLQLGGRENIAQALAIIRWIIQQRNSNGGFVSTQDTVIALQALAEYAKITSQSNVDVNIIAEGENFEENFHLSETNKLVMQSTRVPSLPNTLHFFTASGDGCALIQVYRRYNVKSIPASAAFQLTVTAFKSGASNCNKPNINICARYKINEKTSNMAVIEANMMSGYSPDDWSLQLLNEKEDLSLKRYEVNSNNVVFYFDELSNEEKCFHFTVIQDFEVEDAMPAIVKLYDYYEQESFVAVNYSIQSKCSEDLPNIETHLNDIVSSDEIQQLDVEFVNTSAISNNNVDSERNEELYPSTAEPVTGANRHDRFVDINHELDFPDGLEGNIPLTVMPPQRLYHQPVPPRPIPSVEEQMPLQRLYLEPIPPRPIPSLAEDLKQPIPDGPMPSHSCEFTSVFCPHCVTTLSGDFHNVYCNSSFALLIELRNAVSRRMKIKYDFTPRLNRVERINAFAGYSQTKVCCCSSNELKNLSGMQFLMIGKAGSLWQAEPERHITINRDILIIPVQESMKLPRYLRETQRKCENI